jgi:hypothetical protein
MNISPNSQTVVRRYPIRYDDDFSATYIDEDSDGSVGVDELRTTEPNLDFDIDDIKQQAKKEGLSLLTSEQLGDVELEQKEREYEGGDDYQYVSLESLDDYAGSNNTWAIDPLLGKPGELELIILEK